MSSEALELALALYRAPAQRFVLRDRALPQDIGGVIRLASGNAELLRHAAGILCEPESVVLEAVRFYLQQVLFDPDADAYRVLGLESGAPHERIRQHYHWLQRWLHPDRRGGDWDSLYSTRVNGAWNHLRNKASREAYDLAKAPAERRTNIVHHPVGGVWMPISTALPQRNWLRPAVLGALLTTCAVLLVAVLLREDPAPAEWVAAGRSGVAKAESSTARASGEQRHRRLPGRESVTVVTAGRTQPNVALTKSISTVAPNAVRPALVSVPRPNSAQIRKPDAEMLPQSVTKVPMPGAVSIPADVRLAAHSSTTAVGRTGPNDLSARGRRVGPPALARVETDQRSDRHSSVVAQPHSTTPDAALPSNVETTSAPMAARRIARQLVVDTNRPASRTAGHMARATLPEIPTIVAVKPPVAIDQTADAPPPASTTTTPVDMVARIDLARKRVRDLSAYFDGSKANLAASWLDAPVQVSTESLRSALYARNQLEDFGAFVLESPRWYLSDDDAKLSATYRVRRDRYQFEAGKFFVDMTWRGDTWHVTRVALEPAR
jgi:hypothetical protein